MITFKRIVVERIGISGPKSDHPSAVEWCTENGYAITKGVRHIGAGPFQILAARIVRDGSVVKWKATAKGLRRQS